MGPVHAQGGSLYQQMDAKRRRTDDEDFLEVAVRPTMLPPKRQSNARKVKSSGSRRAECQLTPNRMPQSNLSSVADILHLSPPHIAIINRHHYLKPLLLTIHTNSTNIQTKCRELASRMKWRNTQMAKYLLLKSLIHLQNPQCGPARVRLRPPSPRPNM